MKLKTLILFFVILKTKLFGQTITVDSIDSKILGRKIPTTIILPKNYDSNKTYSVFYFLHSWGGDNNLFADINLLASLNDKPFIVVTPNADTCWYVNSASNPKNKYEDFMTNELFKYIDNKFNTYKTRQAIGGYSMGGYGALLIGLKNSNRFKFIADLSGAINVPFSGIPVTPLLKFLMNSISYSFGDVNSVTTKNSNIYSLTKKFNGSDKPYIFMAIGDHDEFDFLINEHRQYCKLLDENKFKYEYNELYASHMTFEVRWAISPYMFIKMQEILKL